MPRADLSTDLVHWIKADSDEEAFETLKRIVSERALIGGDGHIRGGYHCVCFTEAPESMFHQTGDNRYRPFGIRVSKKWLFSLGGRPVIYQPDAEFNLLCESQKWRHVRYEPDLEDPIDFSWEREWRIQKQELELPSGEARIIVPDSAWIDVLEDEHYQDEVSRIYYESLAYGEAWLFNQPDEFYYAASVIAVDGG